MRKVIIFSCFITAFGVMGHLYADTLTGLPDITVEEDVITSITFDGVTYLTGEGDVSTGTTTRWWTDNGVPTLWEEGDPAPPDNGTGTSNPKVGDVGSHADNFLLRDNGATDISSLDGIDYQETIFPFMSDKFFLFERGGNDSGTWQAIYIDGSLGDPISFSGGSDYANTGANSGQAVYGVAFVTDIPAKGVRITAPGHDTHCICAPTPKDLIPIYPMPLPDEGGKNVGFNPTFQWTLNDELDVVVAGYTIYMDTEGSLVSEPNLPDQPMLLDGTGDATDIAPASAEDLTGQYTYTGEGIGLDGVYYWKIVADVLEPNSVNPELYDVPKKIYGSVWSFSSETSAPEVTIAGSLLTWLEEGQAVFEPDVTVTDATGDLDYIEWSILASPAGSEVTISDTAVAAPAITVNAAGPYLFMITAEDMADNVVEKMVEMDVYANSCLAAQNNPEGYTAPQYDFNGDCIEDVADLAMFLSEWMEDNSMTDPYLY